MALGEHGMAKHQGHVDMRHMPGPENTLAMRQFIPAQASSVGKSSSPTTLCLTVISNVRPPSCVG